MLQRARSGLLALSLVGAACATAPRRPFDLDALEPVAKADPQAERGWKIPPVVLPHDRRVKKVYSGARVDVAFHDADLHNALRFLGEFGGMNLVVEGSVAGSLTLRLRNVPWDQVFDAVLRLHHLQMREENGVVIVAR